MATIPRATLRALGIDQGHGAKVKADKSHGESVCMSVMREVQALTELSGVLEYEFHPSRKWRFDLCYPDEKIALELNGWTSHHRRGRMDEDNVKLAAAVLLGWRVFYATPDQAKKHAALWIVQAIEARQ